MKRYFKLEVIAVTLIVLILAGFAAYFLWPSRNFKQSEPQETRHEPEQKEKKDSGQAGMTVEPISNAKTRITKKPFGIYITPQNSPVSGERFTGYHTGTDFEIMPDETDKDVPIYALCTGKIRSKEIISGYGGVILQDCVINEEPVTVLYGHLDIGQAKVKAGEEIKSGERLAPLAPQGSELSGGERKHLHLGIYKGANIDYRGYVQNENELEAWIDIKNYL
ncbi:M23 family metallopeptidase [candidate division WS5 bacterium]|uniref:M23 family metallopeptidase n=1 Tax=candidate division WS5 bacterium TaxID=2093353 RepID=A0A419DFG9_9BACT|nr:MAG: M23 family metallopeptidase [candidate division WS5 bacterium]